MKPSYVLALTVKVALRSESLVGALAGSVEARCSLPSCLCEAACSRRRWEVAEVLTDPLDTQAFTAVRSRESMSMSTSTNSPGVAPG